METRLKAIIARAQMTESAPASFLVKACQMTGPPAEAMHGRAVEGRVEHFVMADLIYLNDHMARSCECGCVRFNLLRSGAMSATTASLNKKTLIGGRRGLKL